MVSKAIEKATRFDMNFPDYIGRVDFTEDGRPIASCKSMIYVFGPDGRLQKNDSNEDAQGIVGNDFVVSPEGEHILYDTPAAGGRRNLVDLDLKSGERVTLYSIHTNAGIVRMANSADRNHQRLAVLLGGDKGNTLHFFRAHFALHKDNRYSKLECTFPGEIFMTDEGGIYTAFDHSPHHAVVYSHYPTGNEKWESMPNRRVEDIDDDGLTTVIAGHYWVSAHDFQNGLGGWKKTDYRASAVRVVDRTVIVGTRERDSVPHNYLVLLNLKTGKVQRRFQLGEYDGVNSMAVNRERDTLLLGTGRGYKGSVRALKLQDILP